MRREEPANQRFGSLVALTIAPSRNGETVWLCRCDCGTQKEVHRKALKRGDTISCGCCREHHGMSYSSEFSIYRKMKTRCTDPNCSHFADYGGRGIEMRFASFGEFYGHIGPRPSPRHSVDRRDTNGHYEPGNVRWATAKEQANNMRANRRITFGGETRNLCEWGEVTGFGREVIEKRIDKLGWPVERALTTPVKGRSA